MMQGLRHGPERAVAPDWQLLTSIMRPMTRDQRAGCRRWAVRELGIFRDPRPWMTWCQHWEMRNPWYGPRLARAWAC
jgi:hypothetical protein